MSRQTQALTLRISVTDRCQLRCRYCMPAEGVQPCAHQDILSFEEIVAFVRRLGTAFGVGKVRLTGGDPLARRGIARLVAMLSDLGIADLAMTTNAQGLAQAATELRAAGLRRVNISLDSIDPDKFRDVSRGGELARTLEGIEAALAAGLRPIRLNTVVMRGVNDDELCDILSFAMERDCELRFLELMPLGEAAKLFDASYVPAEEVRERLASRFELQPCPDERGSSARRYRVRRSDGRCGVVGFISPCSAPFCSGCTRLRLTSDGHLLGCLARGEGINIRPLIADASDAEFSTVVRWALKWKESGGKFERPVAMASIGG